MLVDVFHQERWDYIYRVQKGGGETTQERIALYFEDDRLIRIDGDFRPQPVAEGGEKAEDVVIIVPDYTGDDGIFTQTLQKIGVDTEE